MDTIRYELLRVDAKREIDRISAKITEQVIGFRKQGVVIGLSGGIDSSTVAALCVRALGPANVLGLLMPERDSSPETLELSVKLAKRLGIESIHEDITGILESVGCYRRRDEAVRSVIPEYGEDWSMKIILPGILEQETLRVFTVVVRSPDGTERSERLTAEAYLGILAASNFKQRVRKMLEYYHADRRNYAVAGTPNRLEYDQGFFVKLGDGAADLKPIAHLYKSQVYQLAEHLDIPSEILTRPPTTDTYSLSQSQEEFFFSVPYQVLDLCLYGKDNGVPAGELAGSAGLAADQIERIYRDIDRKRRSAQYLHAAPVLVEKLAEYDS